MVVMRFLSEENGTSPMRGSLFSRSSFCRPAFAAATINAPSVGSPFTVHFASFFSSPASLHNVAIVSSVCRSTTSIGFDALPFDTCQQQGLLLQLQVMLLELQLLRGLHPIRPSQGFHVA